MKTKIRFLLTGLFFFSIYLLNANVSAKIDSLLKVLKTHTQTVSKNTNLNETDTLQINILNSLSEQYINSGNYDQAFFYANKVPLMNESGNYHKGLSIAYGNMGIISWNKGDYKKALVNHFKSLSIRKNAGDKGGMANSYNNIGTVYWYQGNYESSLENYFKSLEIKEEIKDRKGVAMTYNNIGGVFMSLKKYEIARENFLKCLKASIEIDFEQGIAASYSNLGQNYCYMGNYKDAIENNLKALRIREKIGDKKGVSSLYMNIGNVWELRNNLDTALHYYEKAVEIKNKLGDTKGIGMAYNNIGNIYLRLNKSKNAYYYFSRALVIAKEIGVKDGIETAYFSLSEFYKKNGDFKNALNYHKLYSDIKDSLLNEVSSKQIAEMNIKYESEKKEKDIQLLTKDKELQHAEIDRQKLIRNGFVGGLGIALLLGLVLFNRFHVTRKQKKIIEYQNSQIVESINYSKKIQDSLLPSIESMQNVLPNLFVFYEPKDIVSGDFYFFKEFKNYILLACVDCTGHGVPGGFMSTLGSLLLDKIANDESLKPSEILTKLNDEIIRILHQQSGGELQDGMDLSVCLINRNSHQIEFSGAGNGIIIVSNNEAKRYKANPLPVGGNYMKKGIPIERDFQAQTIALTANEWVYMYTDGFVEQVGGPERIPMNYEQFEKQLIALTKVPTAEEKIKVLHVGIDRWRGENIRTDDALIIGFKLV